MYSLVIYMKKLISLLIAVVMLCSMAVPTVFAETEKTEADADVTFTGIMPDQHLAKWIMNNLNGLPTTIFVWATTCLTKTSIQKSDVICDTSSNLGM